MKTVSEEGCSNSGEWNGEQSWWLFSLQLKVRYLKSTRVEKWAKMATTVVEFSGEYSVHL